MVVMPHHSANMSACRAQAAQSHLKLKLLSLLQQILCSLLLLIEVLRLCSDVIISLLQVPLSCKYIVMQGTLSFRLLLQPLLQGCVFERQLIAKGFKLTRELSVLNISSDYLQYPL